MAKLNEGPINALLTVDEGERYIIQYNYQHDQVLLHETLSSKPNKT